MMKHPEFDQTVALAERFRLELDSSDCKNLVGSQIIPDKSTSGQLAHREGVAPEGQDRYRETRISSVLDFLTTCRHIITNPGPMSDIVISRCLRAHIYMKPSERGSP